MLYCVLQQPQRTCGHGSCLHHHHAPAPAVFSVPFFATTTSPGARYTRASYHYPSQLQAQGHGLPGCLAAQAPAHVKAVQSRPQKVPPPRVMIHQDPQNFAQTRRRTPLARLQVGAAVMAVAAATGVVLRGRAVVTAPQRPLPRKLLSIDVNLVPQKHQRPLVHRQRASLVKSRLLQQRRRRCRC